MSLCVVFVVNKGYFDKFINTCNQLLTNGCYKGNICLVVGEDLNNDTLLENEFILKNNIIIKYFKGIVFSEEFLIINNKVSSDGRNITRKFQWHKLHLFNVFFKNWDYIFYIDCGMTINSDISPIINEKKENTLLAHSDAYPSYEWKLRCQFDGCPVHKDIDNYFTKLNNTYNLNIDYFQTGIVLYHTKIIEENTFDNLIQLMNDYPISRTNEQGIMALYFTIIHPLWEQIKIRNETTYFYDIIQRHNGRYIMRKY